MLTLQSPVLSALGIFVMYTQVSHSPAQTGKEEVRAKRWKGNGKE